MCGILNVQSLCVRGCTQRVLAVGASDYINTVHSERRSGVNILTACLSVASDLDLSPSSMLFLPDPITPLLCVSP